MLQSKVLTSICGINVKTLSIIDIINLALQGGLYSEGHLKPHGHKYSSPKVGQGGMHKVFIPCIIFFHQREVSTANNFQN